MKLKFRDLSPSELNAVLQCAERAKGMKFQTDEKSTILDLLLAHGRCPLDFEKLIDSDDFNFMHDIVGINRHLDHETGKMNHFLPRCSKNE